MNRKELLEALMQHVPDGNPAKWGDKNPLPPIPDNISPEALLKTCELMDEVMLTKTADPDATKKAEWIKERAEEALLRIAAPPMFF